MEYCARKSSTGSALAEFEFISKGALRNPHGVPQKPEAQ